MGERPLTHAHAPIFHDLSRPRFANLLIIQLTFQFIVCVAYSIILSLPFERGYQKGDSVKLCFLVTTRRCVHDLDDSLEDAIEFFDLVSIEITLHSSTPQVS